MRTLGGPLKTGGEGVLVDNFHRWRAKTIPDELVEEIFVPRFAAEIRGSARAALGRALDAEEEGTARARAPSRLRRTRAQNLARRRALHRPPCASRPIRRPRAHSRSCDGCQSGSESAPMCSASSSGAFLNSARSRIRRTSSLPGSRESDGRRRSSGSISAAAFGGEWTRASGPRWWPIRSGLGDYATDLRRHCGGKLLDILLEPRTLARRQIREQAVRSMISELLSGRGRHTQPLGVLLTFELFQRQFIEGEGFELMRKTESAEEV